MRANNNEVKVYGYDGDLPLTKYNWKCATCSKYTLLTSPCYSGYINKNGVTPKYITKFPDKHLEPTDECVCYTAIEYDKALLTEQLDENAQTLKFINEHKDCMVGDNLYVEEQEQEQKQVIPEYNVDENEYNKFKENLIKKGNNLHDALVSAFDNNQNFSVNTNIPNTIEVKATAKSGKIFTATVDLNPEWDNTMKELAIDKSKEALEKQIAIEDSLYESQQNKDKSTQEQTQKQTQESMLNGDVHIGWFNQSTSWKRVMNAARRTIGKKPLDKEPSDSWKAKILLAEHSPIRLLEYDWGWEKIRQWVTVHLVRHHVGVEKFVHSQRSDRRELPCDRDHIYQGARNDMDMTANAQGLINMSRKRCCNCASPETREAWKLVLDELGKRDEVLRSKCVRECVYRGFCPEWMSKCGYYKTQAFKRERADYVNTKFGKDVKYFYYKHLGLVVSNTGKAYNLPGETLYSTGIIPNENIVNTIIPNEVEYKTKFINGQNVVYVNDVYPLDILVVMAFYYEMENTETIDSVSNCSHNNILHIDGNEWNNNIDNLQVIKN